MNAIIYSPEATLFAVASTGEARIYKFDGSKRVATCSGHQGGIFAVAFYILGI